MGMGHGANMQVVTTQEDIAKQTPQELYKLQALLAQHKVSLEELAQAITYDDSIDVDEELTEEEENAITEALTNLIEAFQKKTGIEIFLGYHNSEENGGRYDEVDGAYFGLNFSHVYTLSDEAKALQASGTDFDFKSWVTFC